MFDGFNPFDDLAIFVEQLRDLSFEFGAICLQECWLSETQELSHLYIEGYSCISQIGNIGRKGGLMIFYIMIILMMS